MASSSFGWGDFTLRWLFALLLVGLSYNPTGFSYAHWALTSVSEINALKALAGVALIIGWTIYLRATWRSLGVLGMGLAAALLGCLIWLLFDWGLLEGGSTQILAWLGLFAVGSVMGIGMSWSHVRRRLTGQVDSDDVDE